MVAVHESGNPLCHIAPTADLQDVALKHVQTLLCCHHGWFQPILQTQRPTTLPSPLPGLDSSLSPPPDTINNPIFEVAKVGLNLEDMELSSEEWEEAKTKPKRDEEKDPCFGFLSLRSFFLTESRGEKEELEYGLSLDRE
ncbi:hypothetical protein RJT34_16494 [Clitoria ternatea]|uniref:Uncharacterized protein n=1 Tax=Clitoria ternatea TaxID=43366 RepID=A0AAN9J9A5_CLITE